ncbi:VOC family protein [Actinokineospora sp. NBRC 105648]|uniref:VOC family protein n=1 Tax=Actinokineospora sp. NBRC 105648 TaxID=3032206 RepID=UPI0024A4DC76|nr:VOC family protein [Actinokineospora sp. NBRC 105648]GLZ38272.1 glyoxalase [Actinokineospora sp. NBRC 105648]
MSVPTLSAVVLDCPDARALSNFYASLLGWAPAPEPAEGVTWYSIKGGSGRIDFQQIYGYRSPTWPEGGHPQQLHLDLAVDDLAAAHERAVALGATPLDRSDESFWVYADPAGHPFCLCAC